MRFVLALFLLSLLFISAPAHADRLAEAHSAYDRGHYSSAITLAQEYLTVEKKMRGLFGGLVFIPQGESPEQAEAEFWLSFADQASQAGPPGTPTAGANSPWGPWTTVAADSLTPEEKSALQPQTPPGALKTSADPPKGRECLSLTVADTPQVMCRGKASPAAPVVGTPRAVKGPVISQ